MKIKLSILTGLATLIALIGTARADDTDVYINPGSSLPPNSMPMVMFSLDYRPNLGSSSCGQGQCDTLIAEGYMSPTGPYTYFDVLRGALRKVFDPIEGIKVGLMLNHDHKTNCVGFGRTGCSNGGYIAMGFTEFEANDLNGAKARFHSILDSMPTPQGNLSHSFQGKEMFFEFFRYLTGQGVYNAHNGWTDYSTDNKKNLDFDHPGASWDATIELAPANKPSYDSPLQTAGACSRIYTVNSMFQVSNQDADSDDAITDPISSGGFGSYQKEFADVIQYLNDADLANGNYGTVPDLDDKQNVTSYFLIDGKHINTTTIGYAKAGGTGLPLELSEDPDELVATLQEIFKQILSVSTTFVAASVPVNVFNRAEITDNVYIALFQVDGDGRPAWVGNVKKLKLLGANNTAGGAALIDATGNGAIAGDGRIRFDALTHWTASSELPPADEDAGEVDGRDGRSVARGGAGQKIPGMLTGSPQLANGLGGRTIYFDSTANSLSGFNVDGTTASLLQSDFGVATVNEAGELIAFARGVDIDDLDRDGTTNEARDWIFGDALHSRPMPLNYGATGGYSAGNPAIYLAVASNDGMLRMIRNSTPGGAESGQEVWAFIPRRSMAAQKILRDNIPGTKHPYTFDGAPVAYIQDLNRNGSIESGDKVYLYVGMRRGGKAYYALDVTNPEMPQLMWSIDDSGDFSELGYTFSTPRVDLVKTGSGAVPALIFGGGYDMNKDSRSGVGSDDSEGNAIYVVNAETGQLIWKATGGGGGASAKEFQHPGLVDSIPSSVTTADTDGDGFTDRLLVGDTGGNIWRADLAGNTTADWKLSLLASVGRHGGGSGKGDDRRFFHRPDLVQTKDADGNFDAVLIGSGDRADPLDGGGTTVNYFYMIKDRNTGVGAGLDSGISQAILDDVTSNCLQSGSCTPDLEHGWKLRMETSGEKILATPLTMSGKVFFTSYMPQGGSKASACSPSEGSGRLYAVSLQTAESVINYDSSDDMPSDNDPEGDDPTSKNDRSVELNSAGIPAEVVTIPPNKILRPDLQVDTVDVATRWRTYWFVTEDTDLQ
ncbi:MAG: PilC/PilY family type IV pilus protein [Gammaproteobacteria bacterium]|nr:PilC/PilY family type IV pilus protein [Gammaproteobacteria bacterium]